MWGAASLLYPPLSTANNPALTVPASAVTGLAAACALHPFDFVRGSMQPALSTTTKTSFARSFVRTIPLSTSAFTTFAFGTFFTFRDPEDKLSRFKWAIVSSGLGAFAEVPLDQAKIQMAGGMGRAAVLASTRVPLGALMLFACDTAIVQNVAKPLQQPPH
ncbi:hypothetical protein TeGR_g5017 [Tetraparma gracilis]|jgi:hypothetical protein|uniref:Uncharacterized protein n=1 Tax=Tetraparma gracilis TaxID=2962635 RepID=A0ABQ6MUP1_9STRA|nr:hypothetical protein TeGR_g5017 [Tetraparma gracilis]